MSLPASVTLHTYSPDTLAAVRALHALAFRQLAAGHHDESQIAAHEALIAAPDYAADLARSHLILARHGEDGLIATAGWLALEDRPHTARIRKVFVHPGWARRGLATALVRAAEQAAATAGYPNLYVRANINAVPLYAALGYRAEAQGLMPAGKAELPVVYMSRPAG
ncbi:MAG: GNAT family N-acetyltransferase [Ferrovibrio sp.]|uniref:GNAT family N-acetyltransferase n=1 Tax=Ferrovibrio sp. TaxID=1917215 RepID=UPI00260C04A6|nr:GNAT family N-acetyltransferase [Ferrovibrio sp.]MCW0232260.1 GNAT family N-acetyltransferase [Ferrovibrio sp.]